MNTITGLINGAKLAERGMSSFDLKFYELEIAGIVYHGRLTLRRTVFPPPLRSNAGGGRSDNHEYAWGCFVRLNRADGRHWMLSAYEDSAGTALDGIKEQMLLWAREREAEEQP